MADPDKPAGPAKPGSRAGARERILQTAYDLFCRHGVQAIGVDRIVAEAGVAKMTLYKYFRSKQELIVAALDRREELWTRGWLEREVEQRGDTPRKRLLVVFDVLDEWFRRDDYEGCFFNNSLLEIHDPTNAIRATAAQKRANIRSFLERLAKEGHDRSPQALARDWQLLMTGAIVAADEGDITAARRARKIALLILEREGLDP